MRLQSYRFAASRATDHANWMMPDAVIPPHAGSRYRGRFAPSPTGPLHFGSLVAAVGSFLEARAHHGDWLLRIDDLDRPRCPPKHAQTILQQLEAFGFAWDGEVVWQSRRDEAYRAAFERLRDAGLLYPCACTRRELTDSRVGTASDGSAIYPGTCRGGMPAGRDARAWRLQVGDAVVAFNDALQGPQQSRLAADAGDFVLWRADGLFAYQLAVVVDDHEAGITQVVRGADLLASTPRQCFVHRCLGLPAPAYAHLPVVLGRDGQKLSKQTLACALDPARGGEALVAALDFLGQAPPPALAAEGMDAIWAWARENWSLSRVPRRQGLAYNGFQEEAR